jgi:L-lactate dehydrogenase
MKIGIVGTGFVGSTAAYAMVMRGVGRKIVLIDVNKERARAEADDLLHAVPFAHPLEIAAGNYPDLAGSQVVVFAAGANQRPGETRLDLLKRNAAVLFEVIPNIFQHASEAILVVATNPVDVMTHLAARAAAAVGLPSHRVIGTGTTLDTARFRSLLGRHVGVDAAHVHAHVLGEHGDSEVLTWSLATVGGMPLSEFCRQRGIALDATVRSDIDIRVRRAAYTIIGGKGATYYGIGSVVAKIVDVILKDQRSVLTVCTPLKSVLGVEDVTISQPHLIGGAGVLATFPSPLNDEETKLLTASAEIVARAIKSLD